uniref:Cell wall protein RBR3-like isoform X1 n=1 Tax=Dermatophagoides pteronyssinus TaxID=6956 RepID=A0A6P6YCH9_DERPT|nr:cell wall protein RBR3-like isoform X1 [Dermatophagoides pteronyssinus]
MVFKRQFFEYLSMMIGVIMNEVWMTNGDKSFIMRGIEGKTEWDMVRYPYKTVYGLPKSLQCSESVYHQFNKCEKSSHRKWKVTIDEYFYETKQFCCFVWHTMACEIEIAAKCNRNYSQQIKTNTRQLFTSVCDKISSSQGSWNCWWTEEMIIIIGVAATVITILLIAVGAYFGCRQYRANAKLKAQGKLAEQMNVPLKTTTADTGAPTNVKTLQSNEIPTTADSIDKPIQNVEKQGTVKKWFSNLFSTSKKPELTAKDIGPPTDVKKNDVPIHDILEPRPPEHRTFIPSSAQQQSTMINMNNEKPVEISIVETPVPAKIDTLHLQKPPKDKETDKKLSNLFGRLSLSDSRQSSPTSSPPADKRAKYEPSTSKYEPSSSKSPFSSKKDSSSSPFASSSKYGQSSSKYESSSPFASSSKYGQSSSKYESSSFSTYREPPKYESASSSSSSSSPFSSKKDSSSSSSSPSRFEYSSSPSRYSTSSSSPTQSRYEHSLPQPDKNKQFFRKFTAYKNYETPSSSDSSPSASPYVGRKKKRSIPLETTTTDNQSQPSQQPSQSDQATINLVKDPTNTNKNLTNLTNIIVNLDKINIDPNVKMP